MAIAYWLYILDFLSVDGSQLTEFKTGQELLVGLCKANIPFSTCEFQVLVYPHPRTKPDVGIGLNKAEKT